MSKLCFNCYCECVFCFVNVCLFSLISPVTRLRYISFLGVSTILHFDFHQCRSMLLFFRIVKTPVAQKKGRLKSLFSCRILIFFVVFIFSSQLALHRTVVNARWIRCCFTGKTTSCRLKKKSCKFSTSTRIFS